MVDNGVFATTAQVQQKVGVNASATANVEAYINEYINQAEFVICAMTRYDWITNYASLTNIAKGILRNAASCLAAIDVINYDSNGFFLLSQAESRINVLRDIALRDISILRKGETKTFLGIV